MSEPAPEQQKHVGLTDTQMAAASASTVDPLLLAEGLELVLAEKEMTFKQAFRYHWRAIVWSMVLSMALVMDGMDGSMVSFQLTFCQDLA